MQDARSTEVGSLAEPTDLKFEMNDMLRDASLIITDHNLATRTNLNIPSSSKQPDKKEEYGYVLQMEFTDDEGPLSVNWEGVGNNHFEGNREPFPKVKRIVFRNINVEGDMGNPAIGANFRDTELEMHLEKGGIEKPDQKILDAIDDQIRRVQKHVEELELPQKPSRLTTTLIKLKSKLPLIRG